MLIDITGPIYISALIYLGDDAFEILFYFSPEIFPAFTQVITNMQCPFNNNMNIKKPLMQTLMSSTCAAPSQKREDCPSQKGEDCNTAATAGFVLNL